MRNKYGNKKVIIDGHKFDSKLEGDYYRLLKSRLNNKEILGFQLQPRYLLQDSFKKNGKTIRKIEYVGDFEVFHLDESTELVDIKGMPETEAFKLKKKLFEYKYPEKSLIVMKYVVKYGGWITSEEYNIKRRNEKKNGRK